MSDNPESGNPEPDGSILEHAPVGIVTIDPDRNIISLNSTARALMHAEIGGSLDDVVLPDSSDQLNALLAEPHVVQEIRLVTGTDSKVVEAIALPADAQAQTLFLTDISEKVALTRQLRSTRQPSRKTLNQLHAANTTMLGYAELIAVMLDEEPVVAGDRLNVVKRYHKEIRKSLDTIDRLLKLERLGGRKPEAAVPLNRKHIVVVDDESAIAEYVAELMRGLQHRVSAFSNPSDAISFCSDNANAIDLVITDHRMPGVTGEELATQVHRVRAEVPVVLCSEEEIDASAEAQTYHCPKPIDINDLTRMVSELI